MYINKRNETLLFVSVSLNEYTIETGKPSALKFDRNIFQSVIW